jgi:hypothetical protein
MMTEGDFATLTPPPPPPYTSTPTPPPPPPPYGLSPYAPGAGIAPEVKRGQSIAALVLGCSSLFFYFTLIVPLLAIVFGGIAMSAQRKAGQRMNGMAVAGLVLGIVFLMFGVLFIMLMTVG